MERNLSFVQKRILKYKYRVIKWIWTISNYAKQTLIN